jgi:hypothetical protein
MSAYFISDNNVKNDTINEKKIYCFNSFPDEDKANSIQSPAPLAHDRRSATGTYT